MSKVYFKNLLKRKSPYLFKHLKKIHNFFFKKPNLDMSIYDSINKSGYFDKNYYKEGYNDLNDVEDLLAHYILYGENENRDPNSEFRTSYYRDNNKDLHKNLFYHYIRTGFFEGRKCNPEGSSFFIDNNKLFYSFSYNFNKRTNKNYKFKSKKVLNVIYYDFESISDFKNLKIANSKPRISIIIPFYNSIKTLPICLGAINNNTFQNFEIILICDQTDIAIKKFILKLESLKKIKVIFNDSNKGFSKSCNLGAKIANGEYLFFLNDDCYIDDNYLENLNNYLLQNKNDVGSIGSKILNLDNSLQEYGCYLDRYSKGMFIGYGDDFSKSKYSFSKEVEYSSASALTINKRLFKKLKGFDENIDYCQDSKLCFDLKNLNYKNIVLPSLLCIHELSKSRNNFTKHYDIMSSIDNLPIDFKINCLTKDIKSFAFYLPQYHPFKENNYFWGKGFTEWANIAKAKPNFEGHYQPRIPADLGFYDIREKSTLQSQIKLAKKYHIFGFCYYYYFMNNKRVMSHLFDQIEKNGHNFNFPFVICYANENWTRAWDGQNENILLHSNNEHEELKRFVISIERLLNNKDYYRVDDKPVLLIYNIDNFHNPQFSISLIRKAAKKNIGELYIIACETFTKATNPIKPLDIGVDANVEFPPHNIGERINNDNHLFNNTNKKLLDYDSLINANLSLESDYIKYKSVCLGWDNTPRRQYQSLVCQNSSPDKFYNWLMSSFEYTLSNHPRDKRLVFINAWNEWCEGTYLEPDTKFGHNYLLAHKSAIENINSI